MTDRRRNLAILATLVLLLVGAGLVTATKPTKLGLDLKGGTELVYEGRPTPKVPEVTPQAIDDAVETIRKRTDALGVSEPEIQRAGSNQISIGLPDVDNPQRAIEQVGSTAQLQMYDFEPNLFVENEGQVTTVAEASSGNPQLGASISQPLPKLWDAVQLATEAKPKAEPTDRPPAGADEEELRKAGVDPDDRRAVERFYDRKNDTRSNPALYLFGPDKRPIGPNGRSVPTTVDESITPASNCEEALTDYEAPKGGATGKRTPPKGSACQEELAKLGTSGPPEGSRIVEVPRGIVVVKANRPETVKSNAPFNRYHVVEDDSELSGADIKNPEQNTDQRTNQPIVTMEFTDRGRPAFARLTKRVAERGSQQGALLPPGSSREEANQRFAITLDNEVISDATIDFRELPEGIDGRTGAQIEGLGSLEEAQDLAESLRIGALPIELKLISQTQVSATLGKQALRQGLLAGGAGLALTILFLLVFYRVLGVVAAATLVTYALLLFALVKLIPITLTLPGIAGTILTLAVAADANILIYERIKEEAREGRSLPVAIANGYSKALRSIIDANVVTIGVAFILFMLATAGVKGFAFTLGVGTLVSLFTAVLGTSAILGTMARTRLLGSRFALGAGEEKAPWKNFDFSGSARWFFSMSGAILVAGALAIAGLGINFGIDFESGTRITAPLERPASVQQVRDAIEPLGFAGARVQALEDPELGENVVQISVEKLDPRDLRVERALRPLGLVVDEVNRNSVGPTFGEQIARTALIAIIASLLLISIYIGFRFEFKFAVPILIALAHDLLITAGVYALTDREVTTATVAALLTIMGYSLYDTVIVFDRIRENVPRMPRATFSQIANRSMSEVLTRSLATNFTVLMPVAALMFFGGETLRDFAFALLVGVASGTYSSVFIATPVLTEWKEREPLYMRRRRMVMEQHGGLVPAFAAAAVSGDGGAASGPATPTREARRRPARTAAAPPAPVATPPPKADGGGDGADGAPAPAEPAVTSTGGGEKKAQPKQKRRSNRARKKHGRR